MNLYNLSVKIWYDFSRKFGERIFFGEDDVFHMKEFRTTLNYIHIVRLACGTWCCKLGIICHEELEQKRVAHKIQQLQKDCWMVWIIGKEKITEERVESYLAGSWFVGFKRVEQASLSFCSPCEDEVELSDPFRRFDVAPFCVTVRMTKNPTW